MKRAKNNLSTARRTVLKGLLAALFIFLAIYIFLLFKPKEINSVKREDSLPIIKVSVLNGCSFPSIAREVKDILLDKFSENIDVISWDNVPRRMFIYNQTIIVVKHKDEKKLEFLKKITGIKRRIYACDENSLEDFQIILGKDYKKYFKNGEKWN